MKINKCYLLGFVLICLLIGGCTETSIDNKEEPIKVGWIGPLSGDVATLGIDNLRGVQIAVDDLNKIGGINGRQIRLIIQDDQLDDKQTINAYQKFTTINNVDVILSPSYGGLLSIVKDADRNQNVIVNSLDASEELAEAGEFLFAVGIYDESIGYALADFANNKLKEDKVAVISNQEDPFIELLQSSFEEKYDGQIEISEKYTFATKDFRTVLLKIKNADVDTVVVLGWDESGLIFRQAKELGLDLTFLSIDTVTSELFLKNAGGGEEGTYFTNWDASGQLYQKFENKFVAKFGELPQQPLFSATGYDALLTVAEAMRNGGVNGKSLQQELYAIKNMQGITGTLTMSPDGIVRTVEEEMFQIRDGKFVKI